MGGERRDGRGGDRGEGMEGRVEVRGGREEEGGRGGRKEVRGGREDVRDERMGGEGWEER